MPARSDSVTVRFGNRRPPAWEYPFIAAHKLISLPVAGLQWMTIESVESMERLGLFKPVDPLLRGLPGPFGTRILPAFRVDGLTGVGGGLTVAHGIAAGPRTTRFRLRWISSTGGSSRVTLGYIIGDEEDRNFQFGTGWRIRPNTRYFGTGPNTSVEDKSYFTQESVWVGAHLTRPLVGRLSWRAGALGSWMGHRGPREGESPALEDYYAASLPEGWGRRSDGVGLEFELRHADALTDGRPGWGGVRRARFANFFDLTGTDHSFRSYRFEAEQFVPLWAPFRSLALRGFISWIDSDDPVHFQRLMTNDGPDLLRGHNAFRYRDRGMTVLTAEYRWPVLAWHDLAAQGIDAYLFTDVGQVFGDRRELALENLSASYGFGLRLIGSDGMFGARLEIAFSEEETVLRLRSDQIFQFTKRGLYHGRVPVPAR